PFLAHIRGSEVNRHSLSVRELESAVSQRAFDPLAAFFDRVVRQPHDVEVLHARGADIYLDFNEVGVNSVYRSALRLEEHGVDLAPARSGGSRRAAISARSINQSGKIHQRYSCARDGG